MKNSIFLVENDPFFSKCSECINMHQNVSKCMQNELCKCFVYEILIWKKSIFLVVIDQFFLSAQNASKCMQNELCKCFVHEIIKEVVFIIFKGAKIEELLVSLCDGRHCIYMVIEKCSEIEKTVFWEITYFY